MKRLVTLSIALAGCGASPKSAGRIAGGAISMVGGGLMIDGSSRSCGGDVPDAVGCGTAGAFEGGIGTAILVFGAFVLVVNELHKEPGAPIEADPLPPIVVVPRTETLREPLTNDPSLRNLTREASLAARAGHCSAVTVIASRIERLDESYRRVGFVADPEIAACLR